MQIDNKKRDGFMSMMRDVAENYGCRIKFEWASTDPDNMAVTIMKDTVFVHRSRIYWPRVKSQTDAATGIWSDFFNKYYSDPGTSYARHNVETTKEILNAMYGKSAFNNAACLSIKKVIFNDPATIVFWKDGKKTVVQCRGDDIYDPEKGLAMAISKKVFGNNYNYYKTFKKWLPKEKKTETIPVVAQVLKIEHNENCIQADIKHLFDTLLKNECGEMTISFEGKKEY